MADVLETLKRVEQSITVESPAFGNGDAVPVDFTCQGADASPPLAFRNVPRDAAALALVMDDPNAPRGPFTHWTVWNLDPRTPELAKAADLNVLGAKQGRNDFGSVGYRGPCPPAGEEHRYFVKVYALGERLALPEGADVDAVLDALAGTVIARGELSGTYRMT